MSGEFILDTPVVRAFVAHVERVRERAASRAEACDAIRPRFAELLADPEWLPGEYQVRAAQSGMGGGIVSIHLLTNDTGCVWRHIYDAETGAARPFRSGYVNVPCADDASTTERS